MNQIVFEKLIGLHLSDVEKTVGCNFEKMNIDQIKSIIYNTDEHFYSVFYGMSSNYLSLHTDENDIVESISIHFRKVIDRSFYNSFVEEYGEPNNIQVKYNRTIISESAHSGQKLTKAEFDLKEGTFDEKPLFIIWEKEDYQIKAFLRHESNISEITFSKKND